MRFSFAATIATIAFIASPALAAEPFLGLFLDPNLPPGRGQPVAEITPGGPAEAAGIRQDDRLLSVDGFPIQRATDVGRALQGTHPGERIRVEVERRGRLLRFEVRLGDRQAETEPNRFQAQNEPAEPPPANKYVGVVVILPTERDLEQLKAPARFTRGALVLEVLGGSPAAEAGLRRTDMIVGFDSQAVDSPAELLRRSTQAGAGSEVKLEYVRGEAVREAKLRLADPVRFVEQPVEEAADWSIEQRLETIERQLQRMDARMTRLEIAVEHLQENQRARPLPPPRDGR